MTVSLARLFAAVGAAAATAACAQQTPSINAGPYVPTPTVIVAEVLKMAELKPGDFIIDLGSGDGRIVTTAAKQYGARGFGVEIQPELVDLANNNARNEGVADRVKFVRQDLFTMDVREANVITTYLLPNTVTKLIPKFLAELRPGTRIVSHDYPLAPWEADRVEEFQFEEKIRISGTTRTIIYRYVIPAKIAGTWDARLPGSIGRVSRLTFTQDPTLRVRGNLEVDGRSVALESITLRGEALSFAVPPVGGLKQRTVFSGRIEGANLAGQAQIAGAPAPFSATLRPAAN